MLVFLNKPPNFDVGFPCPFQALCFFGQTENKTHNIEFKPVNGSKGDVNKPTTHFLSGLARPSMNCLFTPLVVPRVSFPGTQGVSP